MAVSPSSMEAPVSEDIPNQFQEIYTIAQQRLAEKRKILLVLDIDGVQDDARLEVEKAIKNHLEKKNKDFIAHIKEKVVPATILLFKGLVSQYFSQNADPFKSWVEYLLLTEINKIDCEEIFTDLEKSSEAKKHNYYLNYCELLKVLRKLEHPTSYEAIMDQITEKITENTALICAMHLSTAICATGDLIVADKSKTAVADLATLYRELQHNGENHSALIQLTARTEAMAYTFSTSLRTTLSNNNTELKSLEDQNLCYSNNQEKFPLHPTSAINESNIITASRNPKEQVIHKLLEQNSLLSNNIHIIFVDDSDKAHEDMAKLPTLPGVHCTLEQITFKRNRSAAEKQAMCVATAENLAKKGLTTAIEEYKKISTEVGDSAASAVIENYVLKLLETNIIDQDKIIKALNPSHALQQDIPSPCVWSDANPNTYYQQLPLNNQQSPITAPTPST